MRAENYLTANLCALVIAVLFMEKSLLEKILFLATM